MGKGGSLVIGIFCLFVLISFVNGEGSGGEVSQPSSGESGGGGGEKTWSSGGGGEVSNFVNVSYDPDLLRVFEDRDFAEDLMRQKNFIGLKIIDGEVWANVIIELKDNSGVEVIGNKSERRELINQKLKWFEPVIKEFVSNLSGSYFRDIKISSEGFGAWVIEEGIEEIMENSRIDKIIWSQYRAEALGNNNNNNFNWQIILFILFLIFLFLIMVYIFVKIRGKHGK